MSKERQQKSETIPSHKPGGKVTGKSRNKTQKDQKPSPSQNEDQRWRPWGKQALVIMTEASPKRITQSIVRTANQWFPGIPGLYHAFLLHRISGWVCGLRPLVCYAMATAPSAFCLFWENSSSSQNCWFKSPQLPKAQNYCHSDINLSWHHHQHPPPKKKNLDKLLTARWIRTVQVCNLAWACQIS